MLRDVPLLCSIQYEFSRIEHRRDEIMMTRDARSTSYHPSILEGRHDSSVLECDSSDCRDLWSSYFRRCGIYELYCRIYFVDDPIDSICDRRLDSFPRRHHSGSESRCESSPYLRECIRSETEEFTDRREGSGDEIRYSLECDFCCRRDCCP